MHELGHNLGLRHGGFEDVGWKPNYLSVMNYSFQVSGVRTGRDTRALDYSRFGPADLPILSEESLDEAAGLMPKTPAVASYWTVRYCFSGIMGFERIPFAQAVTGPADWDCSGFVFGAGPHDVNSDGEISALGSFEDWSHLQFDGGAIGGFGAPLPNEPYQTPLTEPSLEELEAAASAPDGTAPPLPGGGSPPGGEPGDPSASDTTPPETTITLGPKSKTTKKTARFEFTSSEPGSTFECRLDDGAFEACTSGQSYKVKKGKHVLLVRARDSAGNLDQSPAVHRWKLKGAR